MRPLQKTIWRSLKELNTEVPRGPETPHMGTYRKNVEQGVRHACTRAHSGITLCSRGEVQPHCPSAHGWAHAWTIRTVDGHPALTERGSDARRGRGEPGNVLLSDTHQSRKDNDCDSTSVAGVSDQSHR